MHAWFARISVAGMLLPLLCATGCRNLPGRPSTQGAAIGGLGGALAGAALGGGRHQVLGALLGGALGAGGGYIIGANSDRLMHPDTTSAQDAGRYARTRPATAQDALSSTTADLNHDGYVTLDEVVALREAGYSDQRMLDMLEATGQVFDLTPQQEQYLRNNGVSQYVIDEMPRINRSTRDKLLNQQNDVISSPPPETGPPPARP